MSGIEFLLFNIISATSFTLMHAGYDPSPSLYTLFFERGHFVYGFKIMGFNFCHIFQT